MQQASGIPKGIARAILTVFCVVALAGCTLPRSGPTSGEILNAANADEYGMHVVTVTPGIASVARSSEALGFGSEFVGAGAISPDAIAAGDRLSVSVWENVDAGLLAGIGQKVTVLEELQVDQSGGIFVPYAGRIQAAGLSPGEVRASITREP